MKGKGSVILIVGKKDAGKTTRARGLLGGIKKKKYIFDARGEWTGTQNFDFDLWLESALTKKNSCFVVEEATIFLSSDNRDKRVIRWLSGASHDNNIIILLFHSWRRVPVYILDLTDFYFCLKTNDEPGFMANKFRGFNELIQTFEEVRKSFNPHAHVVKKNAV